MKFPSCDILTIVLHFSLIQKWSRQRLAEEDISSPVTQSRQEVYNGYLLSNADVASIWTSGSKWTIFSGGVPVMQSRTLLTVRGTMR